MEGNSMKYTGLFLFILLASPLYSQAAKSAKEQRIESASQFQRWCKQSSYRHFRRKKLQPNNWSASTIRQLNDYQTRGSWRVKRDEKRVFCQIRIGRKAKSVKMKISD